MLRFNQGHICCSLWSTHILHLFRFQRPRDEWVCLPMCAQFHHLTICGGSGIRTPVTVSRNSVFKTDAFDRSAKPPIILCSDTKVIYLHHENNNYIHISFFLYESQIPNI